jgi:pilus assembly protein CpaB
VAKLLVESDLVWKPWPSSMIQPGMIRRRAGGDPVADLRGAFVRQPFLAGEPVRRDKLLRTARNSGYVAATLTPGMRAIAIPIDAQGLATAGGFIFPNDRVDILSAPRAEVAEGQVVRTLLSNVRVLAIGQNIAERAGERVLMGATATLEVTPEQSERLLLAQRTSSLALALRALADAGTSAPIEAGDSIVSVVRYGAQGAK